MDYKTYREKKISRLGFGCMRLPKVTGETYKIDEPKAEELIDKAYRAGVNYFDTAWPYHGKTSEEFVGRCLKKYPRESLNIVTKMPLSFVKNLEEAKAVFSKQLENLQTDYFDFYLLHNTNYQKWRFALESGIYGYLKDLKAKGVIRNLGFSFHGYADEVGKILGEGAFDFVQIQLNYMDWELQNAEKQYQSIASHGLPVMVMEPCRGGFLANPPEACQKLFKSKNPTATPASWAFRWVGSLPNVLVILSGMNSEEQVLDNLATFSDFKPLSEEEQKTIGEARGLVLNAKQIYCTKCHYCTPCTKGIQIPETFEIFNSFLETRDAQKFKKEYQKAAVKASECIQCLKCVKYCPQGIDIPNQLKSIDRSAMSL